MNPVELAKKLKSAPLQNKEYMQMISGLPYNAVDPELEFIRCTSSHNVKKYSQITLGDLTNDKIFDKKSHRSIEEMKQMSKLLLATREKFLRDHIIDQIGVNPVIEAPFFVDYGFNLVIGDNFYCNFNCVFLDCSIIEIGDNVMLGPGVSIVTGTHPVDSIRRNFKGVEHAYGVKIGNECWLCTKSVINPGVEIGPQTVVASGAVVTKSFPEGGVVLAGVPAKVVKKIEQEDIDTAMESIKKRSLLLDAK